MAYASIDELDTFLPQDIRSASSDEKTAALEAASDRADSYLQSRYTLPLTSYGDDLKEAVCALAAYRLGVATGYIPADGTESHLYLLRKDAIQWLQQVAAGEISPAGVVDSGTTTSDSGPLPIVASKEPRGW